MTKKEEIQKGLFFIINKAVRASSELGRRDTGIHSIIDGAVREALLFLVSKDATIKIDRELPSCSSRALSVIHGGSGECPMDEAGYVAVEALIKDD